MQIKINSTLTIETQALLLELAVNLFLTADTKKADRHWAGFDQLRSGKPTHANKNEQRTHH